jgi:hypothetical protein
MVSFIVTAPTCQHALACAVTMLGRLSVPVRLESVRPVITRSSRDAAAVRCNFGAKLHAVAVVDDSVALLSAFSDVKIGLLRQALLKLQGPGDGALKPRIADFPILISLVTFRLPSRMCVLRTIFR